MGDPNQIVKLPRDGLTIPAYAYIGINKVRAVMFEHGMSDVDVVPAMVVAMREYMQDISKSVTADLGSRIHERTGQMRNAILNGAQVSGAGSINSIRAWWNVPLYVRKHEYGAFVHSEGKKLAIPLPDALRPDGTPIKAGPLSWVHFGTFVLKGPSGKSYIVYRRDKTHASDLVYLYVLVDNFVVPARLGLLNEYRGRLDELVVRFADVMLGVMEEFDWGAI